MYFVYTFLSLFIIVHNYHRKYIKIMFKIFLQKHSLRFRSQRMNLKVMNHEFESVFDLIPTLNDLTNNNDKL